MKNLALRGQDEIGLDREIELDQPLLDVHELAAGVHRPLHALAPQLAEELEQRGHDRRVRIVVDQGSIKVGAQQLDHRGERVEYRKGKRKGGRRA